MIGPGGMGQAHIDRIHTVIAGGRVVAVSDLNPDNATAVAERIGGVAHATSTELIESPDVDAVMICSYGPAHEVDVLACIAAGKPVFCEKPLTPTADAALLRWVWLLLWDEWRQHGRDDAGRVLQVRERHAGRDRPACHHGLHPLRRAVARR